MNAEIIKKQQDLAILHELCDSLETTDEDLEKQILLLENELQPNVFPFRVYEE